MDADRVVRPKPSVNDILDQITPFVSDEEHEREFARRFAVRRDIAIKITNAARRGKLTPGWLYLQLRHDPETISVVISLLGLSQEEFYRHVTLARLERRKGIVLSEQAFSEWKLAKIVREMSTDREFADTVFDLLLNGIRDADLRGRVPPFLLAKLDGTRLATIGRGGIDALVRIGLKGPYDAKKGEPVVEEVRKVLDSTGVRYLIGEIKVAHLSRKFDCVVPDDATAPHVLIEVGVFATTARELSEKGLVEQHLYNQVREYYPGAVVVRVVGG